MLHQCSLKTTIDTFHQCSYLPIKALDVNGIELSSAGFSAIHNTTFSKHFSLETIKEQLKTLSSHLFTTYSSVNGVSFTLCRASHVAEPLNVFIIGPYTTIAHIATEELVFKPLHCIPHLIKLLVDITKEYLATSKSITLTAPSTDYSYHVTRAKHYIEQHYATPITLDALAKHLGINKHYLCTIFKKTTHQSFCNYLNRFRVAKSKDLLIHTKASVLDIALSTGFSSASYYTSTFKKLTGHTPLNYRAKKINEKEPLGN